MQPSAMAPRAKTAASRSFQAASPVADNLACKNLTSETMYLEAGATSLRGKLFYNRILFYSTCTQNLHNTRILPDVPNKVMCSRKIYSY